MLSRMMKIKQDTPIAPLVLKKGLYQINGIIIVLFFLICYSKHMKNTKHRVSPHYVIGDKAYDSDAFIAEITSHDAIAVIPPRKNSTETRTYDKELSKLRNIIERFFHRLKQYRRVATRYDKLSVWYLGFAYFASILMQSKKM